MWVKPPLPNGSAVTFSWLVPQSEPWEVLAADAPPAKPDVSKFYGAKEAQMPQFVAIKLQLPRF
jgi:hypothetical protein